MWALIVTYPTFLVPFCTWLLMGYFRTVPKEIEECAMVDGATRIQTLWRIVLPIAVPGLVCAALFAFTLSWNEFIYALTFVSSRTRSRPCVGVTAELIRGDIYYWGSLMAGAVLGSVPIVIALRVLPRLLRLRPYLRSNQVKSRKGRKVMVTSTTSRPRRQRRRQFLRNAAGAAGGLGAVLALRQAPALAQTRELTFLTIASFVPDTDKELKRQFEEWGKQKR